MAYVTMHDGHTRIVTADQAREIWSILNNEREPINEEQAQFCMNVKRVLMNRKDPKTPWSYLKRYPVKEDPPKPELELPWWNK